MDKEMKMASAPDAMDERNQVMEMLSEKEFGKPLKELSDDELRARIAMLGTDASIGDSTGFFHSEQDRKRHIEGALQRLRDKRGGRLDLTDSEKRTGGVSTGRHDELDAMDFDDINSGWDSLEDWEQDWLLANRFDELPMWVQEAYS